MDSFTYIHTLQKLSALPIHTHILALNTLPVYGYQSIAAPGEQSLQPIRKYFRRLGECRTHVERRQTLANKMEKMFM